MMIAIVGAGGTASYLVPALVKIVPKNEIHLIDGDILEKKNLDRQLFSENDIGLNKAEALARMYALPHFMPEYLGEHTILPTFPSIWFCCADNHSARRAVLKLCDEGMSECIICGNEYTDAEAYYYTSAWAGTEKDPRIFYPEILTDKTGDPMAPGCTGFIQVQNRQLAISNLLSAAYALHLYWIHLDIKEEERREKMDSGFLPVHHFSNFAKLQTKAGKDYVSGPNA